MNAPTVFNGSQPLPDLVQRAADALLSAKSSAEVLEARDMANVAYHAAKHASRIARAKEAHDTLISEVYRAQADALLIEARAKVRLADEYDAAQDRGEVATVGTNVGNDNVSATAADLGIRRDEIHESRQIRDAERAEPGLAERALKAMVDRGEEPTKAKLRSEIAPKPKPKMDREPLWVWGRVKDFSRDGILDIPPTKLAAEMTDAMRADLREQLPEVINYLAQLRRAV